MRCVVVLALLGACGDDFVAPPHADVVAIVDGRVEILDTATHDRAVVPEVVDAEYVAWSHDGSRLATLTTQQELRVFDLATGSFVMTLTDIDRQQPLWSPDDKRLLVSGAIVSPEGRLIDLPGTATHLAWSASGHIVQFPNGESGHCLSCTVDGMCREKVCSALSPEGDLFAVPRLSADHSRTVVDYLRADDDQLLGTIDCSGQSNGFPWSARSIHAVVCLYDPAIRFFDPTTATVTSLSTGNLEWAEAWSPDGEYLATSLEVVRMTDHAVTPLATRIDTATWSSNNEYFVGWSRSDTSDTAYSVVSIFGPAGTQTPLHVQGGFLYPVPTVFSPSGNFFALEWDSTPVCDPSSFTCTYPGEGTLTWLDDDRYLMLRRDGRLDLVDRATGVADELATNVTAVALRSR